MTGTPDTFRTLIDGALKRHGTTSVNHLARIARDGDHTITQTTLSQIRNGTYRSTPQPPTLRAIAYLAGVSYDRAVAAAGLPPLGLPYVPPPGSDRLTPRERDVVDSVIRAILAAREGEQ